jgi:hypothetical protein
VHAPSNLMVENGNVKKKKKINKNPSRKKKEEETLF